MCKASTYGRAYGLQLLLSIRTRDAVYRGRQLHTDNRETFKDDSIRLPIH